MKLRGIVFRRSWVTPKLEGLPNSHAICSRCARIALCEIKTKYEESKTCHVMIIVQQVSTIEGNIRAYAFYIEIYLPVKNSIGI